MTAPARAQHLLEAKVPEKVFQSQVVAIAQMNGWLVAHFRPAQDRRGRWSTPIQGSRGYPDLTMTRGGRLIIAELKTQSGRVSPAQRDWLTALERTPAEVHVWRPRDWDRIVEALS